MSGEPRPAAVIKADPGLAFVDERGATPPFYDRFQRRARASWTRAQELGLVVAVLFVASLVTVALLVVAL